MFKIYPATMTNRRAHPHTVSASGDIDRSSACSATGGAAMLRLASRARVAAAAAAAADSCPHGLGMQNLSLIHI